MVLYTRRHSAATVPETRLGALRKRQASARVRGGRAPACPASLEGVGGRKSQSFPNLL